MVRGLVRRRLLRALSGTKSARAWKRQPPCFAWWVLAAPYKGHAHRGALQHSAGVSIRGLRIPDRAGVGPERTRGCLRGAGPQAEDPPLQESVLGRNEARTC